ncbi:Rossmann-fold superfamily protein [Perilla frutescens var. hirtella]|uniref:Rossmann-fold superfamily protein n=1 Tax=Perilla frutescens var. hirtella TaxID=608512 RepID=A0AAD4IYT2_PERFH|nr:Rossmann-fold superfamily protein [Perilla frutescens var. hirtella]
MLSFTRIRSQPRSNRSLSLGGIDYADPKKKNNFCGKILMVSTLTALCILMLKHSPNFNTPSQFSSHESGVTHVLVTGGAGYIGSHAALRLLKDFYRVTIVDNLSRGNLGAIHVLQQLFPEPGRLQFIYADLGDTKSVQKIFSENAFDAVIHFAAVAYVGESTLDPLKYYHNITSNTLVVLEAMAAYGVKTLIYSSTCATYGEPETMPITEETPQLPINPYGKAKKMAEDIILDFHKNSDMAVMILRYFNVIGSDPEGRLGEAPRPELREHGRISGACFDAARGIIPGLKVRGTDYKTTDGTCIRDYIDVTDLVDAHVKALEKAKPGHVGIYNVGTGKGRSVKEFVEACKKATGVPIKVDFLPRRPGDYAEVFSDPTKIKNELNWTAKHTNLQESLQVAWRWQKEHLNGYVTPLVMSA